MPRDPDELTNRPTSTHQRNGPRASAGEVVPRTRLAPLTPADRERCRREGRCFRCRLSGHRVSTCPQNSTHPHTRPRDRRTQIGGATFGPRLAPLTPALRERCRREGLCFRCRKHGHKATSCPQSATRRPLGQSDTAQTQPRSQQIPNATPLATSPPRPSSPTDIPTRSMQQSRQDRDIVNADIHAWIQRVVYEPPPRPRPRPQPPLETIPEEPVDPELREYGYDRTFDHADDVRYED
ncbi:hypothetical protein EDB86DRAFT_3009668 [Lactarius hatsudake]|nr:hypothetical protein EDB86DRAFT_3009668 [Lactarius hatsudake]